MNVPWWFPELTIGIRLWPIVDFHLEIVSRPYNIRQVRYIIGGVSLLAWRGRWVWDIRLGAFKQVDE